MKKTIFCTCIVLIFFSFTTDNKKNDLENENLNGNVKSVKRYYKPAVEKFGEITEKKKRTGIESLKIFNDIGNLTVHNMYDWDGNLTKYIFKYDDNGNVIARYDYNSDGSLRFKSTIVYDDNGNGIEDNIYNSDGDLKYKHIKKYDNKGNRIEDNVYNSDGSLLKKRTIKYDDNGNKIEINGYINDPLGYSKKKSTFIYDDKGNEIEEIRYDFSTKNTFKYDVNGNVIESLHRYIEDGSLDSKTTNKYEFDKKGNWIKKIEIVNESPESVFEREIEYYD